MLASAHDLLAAAVARNAGIVLSLPSAGMLRHHKSRFLGEQAGEGIEGIIVESIPGERPLIDELITEKKSAGISFKTGPSGHGGKAMFASMVLRRLDDFPLRAGNSRYGCTQALVIARPQHIESIQRRADYRVAILPDDIENMGLGMRIWRIAPHVQLRDRPIASAELPCTLRDLSLGGVGVTFTPRRPDEPIKLASADRLRIQLTCEGRDLLFEASLKYPAIVPSAVTMLKAGLQFKSLQQNLEGRQVLAALTRVTGELRRAEIRRRRLGIVQTI